MMNTFHLLRLKNEEEEVEKFVMANTQELAKDKWLCPLSGMYPTYRTCLCSSVADP
jgi:hypothetical protein